MGSGPSSSHRSGSKSTCRRAETSRATEVFGSLGKHETGEVDGELPRHGSPVPRKVYVVWH